MLTAKDVVEPQGKIGYWRSTTLLLKNQKKNLHFIKIRPIFDLGQTAFNRTLSELKRLSEYL